VSKDSDQTETAPRKFKLGPLGNLNRVTKGLAKTIRAMADGTLDSQVGARICNGLGIMRTCLETQKLEQLEARMDEIADRVGLVGICAHESPPNRPQTSEIGVVSLHSASVSRCLPMAEITLAAQCRRGRDAADSSVSPLPGDQNRGETHATPQQTEVGTPPRAAQIDLFAENAPTIGGMPAWFGLPMETQAALPP